MEGFEFDDRKGEFQITNVGSNTNESHNCSNLLHYYANKLTSVFLNSCYLFLLIYIKTFIS